MITTNARNLRMNLKAYLDDANENPIRILRGAKQTFVLMNEEEVQELNRKVDVLQSKLLATLHRLNEAENKEAE